MSRRLAAALVVLALSCAAQSAAALENENLLVTMPDGYKVGHQQRVAKQMISEMVPGDQTVQTWTEMVTVQIFFGMNATPAAYRANMEGMWSGACPGSTFGNVAEATENGYPTVTWSLNCPLNPQTKKPEITFMKAIQGKDSFYLVQKAFRFEPSAEASKQWLAYLAGIRACDTRIAEQPCRLGK